MRINDLIVLLVAAAVVFLLALAFSACKAGAIADEKIEAMFRERFARDKEKHDNGQQEQ